MALHVSGLEHVSGPVCVSDAVPLKGLVSCGALELLVFDVFACVEQVRHLAELLQRMLEVVEDAAFPAGVGSGLGGDEHYAVTGLDTVDCGRGGILEDLHGLDVVGVEVVDRIDLEAVDDYERSGLGVR